MTRLTLTQKISLAIHGLGVKGHEKLLKKIHEILAKEFEQDPDIVRAWLATKPQEEEFAYKKWTDRIDAEDKARGGL